MVVPVYDGCGEFFSQAINRFENLVGTPGYTITNNTGNEGISTVVLGDSVGLDLDIDVDDFIQFSTAPNNYYRVTTGSSINGNGRLEFQVDNRGHDITNFLPITRVLRRATSVGGVHTTQDEWDAFFSADVNDFVVDESTPLITVTLGAANVTNGRAGVSLSGTASFGAIRAGDFIRVDDRTTDFYKVLGPLDGNTPFDPLSFDIATRGDTLNANGALTLATEVGGIGFTPLPVTFTVGSNDITLSPRDGMNTDLVSTFDRILRSADQDILNIDIPDGLDFDVNTGGRAELRFRFSLPAGADLSPGSTGARNVFLDMRGFDTIRQTGTDAGQQVDITAFSTTLFPAPSNVDVIANAIDNRVRTALNSVETGSPWRTNGTRALVNGVASTEATTNGVLQNATIFEIIVRSDNMVSPADSAAFGGTAILTYAGSQEVDGVDNGTIINAGARNTGPLTVDLVYRRAGETTDEPTVRVATFDTTQENIDSAELRGRIGAHGTTTAGLTASVVAGTRNVRFVLDDPQTFSQDTGTNLLRVTFDGTTTEYAGVVTALDPYITQTEMTRESDREIFRLAPATIFQGEVVAEGSTLINGVRLDHTFYRRRGAEFLYFPMVQENLGGVFKRGNETTGLLTDMEIVVQNNPDGTTTVTLATNESDSPDTNIFTLLDG